MMGLAGPIVLSLCDLTGNMVRPWASAGWDCVCIDTQHSIRRDRTEGRIAYRWADVRSLTPADFPDPAIVFAFPPCTNLAVSGARDFRRKGLRGLIDGLELVEACRRLAEWYGCPWMLENPVSRLASCWRKPDHIFQPWQYGDNTSKATCLWTGGGFVMPEPAVTVRPADVEERVWKMPPSANRANERSATSRGFAEAVFEANEPVVRKRAA